MGPRGPVFLILGGAMYSIGSVLYGPGAKRRCRRCVFHVFCMPGAFCRLLL